MCLTESQNYMFIAKLNGNTKEDWSSWNTAIISRLCNSHQPLSGTQEHKAENINDKITTVTSTGMMLHRQYNESAPSGRLAILHRFHWLTTLIIHHPSLFYSRLKTFLFRKSFPTSPSFSSSGLTPRISQTDYQHFWAYPFSLFSSFLGFGSVR